jgi:hypothetical protein
LELLTLRIGGGGKQEQKEAIEEKHEVSELVQKYGTKMAHLIKLLGDLLKKKDNRIIIFSQWDGMLHQVTTPHPLSFLFLFCKILFVKKQKNRFLNKINSKVGDTLKDNGINNVYVRGNVWQVRSAPHHKLLFPLPLCLPTFSNSTRVDTQQRNKAIGTFKESEDEDPKSSRVIMLSLEKAASGTNLVRPPPSSSFPSRTCDANIMLLVWFGCGGGGRRRRRTSS